MSLILRISEEEKIKTIKKFSDFIQVDYNLLSPLVPIADACGFKRGDLIFREHDEPKFQYIVQKGHVKCFKQAGTGKYFVAYVASEGGSLNGIAVFSGLPHFLSAQAIDEVALLRLKREDYLRIINRDQRILLSLMHNTEQALRCAYDRLMDAVGERADQRVCNILFMLQGKFGPVLQFSGEEIAELTGTTTETTLRSLSTLKQLKIIDSGRREIRILDVVGLKNISHFPDYSPGRA